MNKPEPSPALMRALKTILSMEDTPVAPAQNTPQQILNEIALALESRGFAHCCNGKSVGDILDMYEKTKSALEEISAHLFSVQDMARCRGMATEVLSKCL